MCYQQLVNFCFFDDFSVGYDGDALHREGFGFQTLPQLCLKLLIRNILIWQKTDDYDTAESES